MPNARLLLVAQPSPTDHPEPQFISCGGIRQGIPLRRTNKTPWKQARSDKRGFLARFEEVRGALNGWTKLLPRCWPNPTFERLVAEVLEQKRA